MPISQSVQSLNTAEKGHHSQLYIQTTSFKVICLVSSAGLDCCMYRIARVVQWTTFHLAIKAQVCYLIKFFFLTMYFHWNLHWLLEYSPYMESLSEDHPKEFLDSSH